MGDTYLFYCCPECDHKCKSKHSFVNHAYSTHPDAKENLRFARASLRFDQKMEDIIVKSDVNIKKENLEPENNYQDHFNTDTVKKEPGNENDTDLDFNNDNQYWYEPE